MADSIKRSSYMRAGNNVDLNQLLKAAAPLFVRTAHHARPELHSHSVVRVSAKPLTGSPEEEKLLTVLLSQQGADPQQVRDWFSAGDAVGRKLLLHCRSLGVGCVVTDTITSGTHIDPNVGLSTTHLQEWHSSAQTGTIACILLKYLLDALMHPSLDYRMRVCSASLGNGTLVEVTRVRVRADMALSPIAVREDAPGAMVLSKNDTLTPSSYQPNAHQNGIQEVLCLRMQKEAADGYLVMYCDPTPQKVRLASTAGHTDGGMALYTERLPEAYHPYENEVYIFDDARSSPYSILPDGQAALAQDLWSHLISGGADGGSGPDQQTPFLAPYEHALRQLLPRNQTVDICQPRAAAGGSGDRGRWRSPAVGYGLVGHPERTRRIEQENAAAEERMAAVFQNLGLGLEDLLLHIHPEEQ